MTFFNMHSAGLKILATHRLISDIKNFDETDFLRRAEQSFNVTRIDSLEALTKRWAEEKTTVFGIVLSGGMYTFEAKNAAGQLDVPVLHQAWIGGVLAITENQGRYVKRLRYM